MGCGSPHGENGVSSLLKIVMVSLSPVKIVSELRSFILVK